MIKHMRQSFDNYYKKLNVLYKKEYGTRPTVTFDSKLKKEVIISKENSDGEVEWKMYPVSGFSKGIVSEQLGFKISDDVYEYYSTYYYAHLTGRIDDTILYFIPNGFRDNLISFIKQQYVEASYYFPEKRYFLLGTANKNSNDDMLIFFDNDNNRIFLHDIEVKTDYELDDLVSLVWNMEACE